MKFNPLIIWGAALVLSVSGTNKAAVNQQQDDLLGQL